MADVDEIRIGPSRAELETALKSAVAAVNKGARKHLLTWPLPELAAFLDAFAAQPEGYRQWNGEGLASPRLRANRARSIVAVAWWADAVGRKHTRLAGRRGPPWRASPDHLMWPPPDSAALPQTMQAPPPLAVIHRAFTFLHTQDGRRRVLAVCPCGVGGEPAAIAWMGACCGPCRDRRQLGETAATPIAGRFEFQLGPLAPALAFNPDGRTLAVGSARAVQLWDIAAGRERLALLHGEHVEQVAFADNGSTLGAAGRHVSLWQGERSERPADCILSGQAPIALTADGALLASARSGGLGAQVHDGDGRHLASAESLWPDSYISGLAFEPAGYTLAVATGSDGHEGILWEVRFWDALLGRPLPGTFRPGRAITALAFSPDGRMLAVGTGAVLEHGEVSGGMVQLWDRATGERTAILGPHTGRVQGLAFLPDGQHLVAAGNGDTTVRLWDLAANGTEAMLEWHQNPLHSLAVSADGSWLATGDASGVVRLWPLDVLFGV